MEEARASLRGTLPDGAEVFDETPRSIGARVPALGDGIYRAAVEGSDGNVLVWAQLVAYGAGRDRLAGMTAELGRALESAVAERRIDHARQT